LAQYENLWHLNAIDDFSEVSLSELNLIDNVKELISELSGIKLVSDKKVLFFEAQDYMYSDFFFIHLNNYHRFIWQSGA